MISFRIEETATASWVHPASIAFDYAAPADDARPEALVWIRPTRADSAELLVRDGAGARTIICNEVDVPVPPPEGKCLLVVSNPKVVFSRVLAGLFQPDRPWGIHPTAVVDPEAVIEEPVLIGPYSIVGRASIGAGTAILSVTRTSMTASASAETSSSIRGCVIGADGFGFEPDETGRLEKFLDVGGVVIQDDVEIQALTAIDRGSLGDTVIRRGAKIDNLVHVAHNVDVGEDALVIAHCMLGGSVKVGARSWLGPGSAFRDNIVIGDDAFVGIGALVVKDVAAGATVMGSPAGDR